MNKRQLIVPAILSAMLAVSGTASAQAAGGGNAGAGAGGSAGAGGGAGMSGGAGGSAGGQATGVYPAPTQGVEQDPSVTGAQKTPAHRTQSKKHMKRPMNGASGATTMPGGSGSNGGESQ